MGRIWILCSYCGRDIGYKDGDGMSGVSHGICDVCYLRFVTEWRPCEPSEDQRPHVENLLSQPCLNEEF